MTDLPLHKISETATKIVLGWTAVPGAIGYRFQSGGTAPKWSHTWDAARSQVTFAKAPPYTVQALGTDAEGLYPPVTPPPSTLLAFRPPGYQGGDPRNSLSYPGYEVRHFNDATRDISAPIDSGRNVVIIQDGASRAARIMGWRNAVYIGGKLDQTTQNDNGLNVTAISGELYLEGVDIGGAGVRDAVGLMTGHVPPQAGATVTFQNCRLRAHTWGDFHGDCIQIWGDPDVGHGYSGGLGQLRVDKLTCVTDLQCLFLRNDVAGQLFEGGDIRRVNMEGSGGYFFFKGVRTDASGHTSIVTLTDVWMNNTDHWSSYANMVAPNEQGSFIPDGPPPDPTRAAKVGTDKDGTFVSWPSTGDVKGVIRIGSPPGGDFVPASVPGLGYVPPGYA